MSQEEKEKIIAVLIEKINSLETELFIKKIENQNLKEELKQIKKDGKEDEE